MRQTIPFKKDITFKTKIGEITAISLDNDLMLKGEDLISGNFYISGTYKMLETSTILENYSYKIPCEIAISEDYDTFDATVDIDDFYYEIIDDEILRVNIVVAIDNLKKKEESEESLPQKVEPEEIGILDDEEEERCYEEESGELNKQDFNDDLSNVQELEEEKDVKGENVVKEEKSALLEEKRNMSFLEVKETVKNENDTYLTYKVYIFKDGDSIENILEKYQITKDDLADYNNLEDIVPGSKLVIPSSNAEL